MEIISVKKIKNGMLNNIEKMTPCVPFTPLTLIMLNSVRTSSYLYDSA